MIGEGTAPHVAEEGQEEAQDGEEAAVAAGTHSAAASVAAVGSHSSSARRGLGFGVRVQERCERWGAGTKS